jgi:hypothetical protein
MAGLADHDHDRDHDHDHGYMVPDMVPVGPPYINININNYINSV